MQRKPSRQALRTKKLLQQALISLIQEQEFNSLRVQDITDRADLGRATFYLHYADKEDLLTAIVDQSYHEIADRLEREGQQKGLIRMKWALEYASENPDLFGVVMGHPRTVDRIRSLMIEHITADFFSNAKSDPTSKASAHILAGALLGVFSWWQTHNDLLSPDDVLTLFSNIISADIQNLKSPIQNS